MLKTNILGSVLICSVLFSIIAYLFSLAIDINWPMYFRIVGVVAVIALIIAVLAREGGKGHSH
ncbi:MAG: hypothetical protein ACT4NX_08175 [Deltaproteobacteria bacterium]